jgi:predicted lactoylglutathione lyase
MEQRLTLITLGVKDLARAQGFYERLGWRRGFRKAEGVAFFQAGGVVVSLWPLKDLAKDAKVPMKRTGFRGFALAYNARSREEVDAVLAEAKAAGARILKPAKEVFWGGYAGYFADLDDFAWEVAWNPGFPLNLDGTIRLPE